MAMSPVPEIVIDGRVRPPSLRGRGEYDDCEQHEARHVPDGAGQPPPRIA